ncbi:niemann-Pick disease type C2 protein hE1 [Schizosaccharomyces japonicus yFS275]|uniref:Phosphatidylglycerol/phosphatidylinositol transfer protein n=1 Tax=Schizosaccharomyces japonicus (strain yFS275 / FY16936) TaxID=402676 RepID=B6JXU4_SCHJY|nr:niemann-Pick disease type C2 protein hE1 [Schizosaccharomyces japonicus yFS275]EEB06362.1 niemann-Pick disease type C2 protein hE1 [Schizosaccharomyces japonicus yFS275]
MKYSVLLFALSFLPMLCQAMIRPKYYELQELKIPGDNPAYFCNNNWDHSLDTLQINYLNLVPNPPRAGKNLSIETQIAVNTVVEEGSYVLAEVKYGFVRIVNEKLDLCEQADLLAGIKCPVGPSLITKTIEVPLPWAIPPGTYHVNARVFNANDEQLTCVTASVSFRHFG